MSKDIYDFLYRQEFIKQLKNDENMPKSILSLIDYKKNIMNRPLGKLAPQHTSKNTHDEDANVLKTDTKKIKRIHIPNATIRSHNNRFKKGSEQNNAKTNKRTKRIRDESEDEQTIEESDGETIEEIKI